MTASSASRSSVSDQAFEPGEVHLWLCSLDVARSLDQAVLSAEERSRYASREEAACGRTLTRHLLSRYAPEGPADWRFEAGRHGKPRLLAPSQPLEFNLSHSGQWLALALSPGVPVGVDVQALERHRPLQRLARRYYSAAERDALEALDADSYCREFYRLWSLKEAWTKARGGALPTALGETGFRVEGGTLVSLDPAQTADSSLWSLEPGGYSLALCALEPGLSLRCRRWLGGASDEALDLPCAVMSDAP